MDILTKFNELLFKKKKSFSDYKNLLLMNRTHELKLSDLSLEYGVELVKNYRKRLGTECKRYFLLSFANNISHFTNFLIDLNPPPTYYLFFFLIFIFICLFNVFGVFFFCVFVFSILNIISVSKNFSFFHAPFSTDFVNFPTPYIIFYILFSYDLFLINIYFY